MIIIKREFSLQRVFGPRISGFAESTTTINGPISIAKNNFVSNLEYSGNYEVSFEFKAIIKPSNGYWHQILEGKFILIDIKTDLILIKMRLFEFTCKINIISKISLWIGVCFLLWIQ